MFTRNSQTQASRFSLRIVPEYCEICIAQTMIVLKDALELFWLNQSLTTSKSLPVCIDYGARINGGLNAEAFTAFRAASIQYSATTTCAHACTKTVSALAF